MPIDEALLEGSRYYEDPQRGISEEFLRPEIGGARTVAVLSRPLGEQAPLSWVICHSFGREQTVLTLVDVAIARALSSRGFPVLRYHGRGYADSDGRATDISLASHLEDAADACELLTREAGVPVGIVGIRFGGTVAALTGAARSAPAMVLIEPIVRGAAYMRDLLRSELFFRVMAKAGGGEGGAGDPTARPDDPDELRRSLDERGWIDVQGFRLDRRAYEEICAIDLLSDLERAAALALVVAVAAGPTPRRDITSLGEHLRSLGTDLETELVQDPVAAEFGQRQYSDNGEARKTNQQAELAVKLADIAAGWAATCTGTTAGV